MKKVIAILLSMAIAVVYMPLAVFAGSAVPGSEDFAVEVYHEGEGFVAAEASVRDAVDYINAKHYDKATIKLLQDCEFINNDDATGELEGITFTGNYTLTMKKGTHAGVYAVKNVVFCDHVDGQVVLKCPYEFATNMHFTKKAAGTISLYEIPLADCHVDEEGIFPVHCREYSSVIASDNYWVIGDFEHTFTQEFVAEIVGETPYYYTSINAALEDAQEGDTVKVLGHEGEDEYVNPVDDFRLHIDKDVTLDLNGHTVYAYVEALQKNVTIKDGALVTPEIGMETLLGMEVYGDADGVVDEVEGDAVIEAVRANLTLKNVNVTGFEVGEVDVRTWRSYTWEAGRDTDSQAAIFQLYGKLTLSGNTEINTLFGYADASEWVDFTAPSDLAIVSVGGKVSINVPGRIDGDVQVGGIEISGYGQLAGSELTIKNANVNGEVTGDAGTGKVYAGTYQEKNDFLEESVVEGKVVARNTDEDGLYYMIADAEDVVAVSQEGYDYYAYTDLQLAFDDAAKMSNARNDFGLMLVKDVEAGDLSVAANLDLDLNGYEIKADSLRVQYELEAYNGTFTVDSPIEVVNGRRVGWNWRNTQVDLVEDLTVNADVNVNGAHAKLVVGNEVVNNFKYHEEHQADKVVMNGVVVAGNDATVQVWDQAEINATVEFADNSNNSAEIHVDGGEFASPENVARLLGVDYNHDYVAVDSLLNDGYKAVVFGGEMQLHVYEQTKTIKEQKEALEALQAEYDNYVADAEAEIAGLNAQVAGLEFMLAGANFTLNQYKALWEQDEVFIKQLKNDMDKLVIVIAGHQDKVNTLNQRIAELTMDAGKDDFEIMSLRGQVAAATEQLSKAEQAQTALAVLLNGANEKIGDLKLEAAGLFAALKATEEELDQAKSDAAVDAQAAEDKIAELQGKIEELNNKVANLKNSKKDLEVELAKAELQYNDLSDDYGDLVVKYNEKVAQVDHFNTVDLPALQAQIADLETRYAALEQANEDLKAANVELQKDKATLQAEKDAAVLAAADAKDAQAKAEQDLAVAKEALDAAQKAQAKAEADKQEADAKAALFQEYLETRNGEYNALVAKAEADLTAKELAYKAELEAKIAEYEAKLAELKAEDQAAMDAQKAECDYLLDQAQKQLKAAEEAKDFACAVAEQAVGAKNVAEKALADLDVLLNDKLDSLQANYDALLNAYTALVAENEALVAENTQLKNDNAALEAVNTELSAKVTELEAKLVEMGIEVKEANDKVAATKAAAKKPAKAVVTSIKKGSKKGTAVVTLKKISGATRYKVWYKDSKMKDYKRIWTTKTKVTIKNLKSGSKVTVYCRAYSKTNVIGNMSAYKTGYAK